MGAVAILGGIWEIAFYGAGKAGVAATAAPLARCGAVKRRQIVELGDRVPIDGGTFAEGFVSPGLKSRRQVFAHLDSAALAGGTGQLGNGPLPLYLADRGSPCSALSSPAWMM